jgi:predicted nucleic acid-binding protein
MYLVGSDERLKLRAAGLAQSLASGRQKLVTDAEVFQEILHRYVAIGRREAIQPAFDVLSELAEEVWPIDLETVQEAKNLIAAHSNVLSARDAIHAAGMRSRGVQRILTLDSGFDALPDIERIGR